MIQNLISNSIKYGAGDIKFDVKAGEKITITYLTL